MGEQPHFGRVVFSWHLPLKQNFSGQLALVNGQLVGTCLASTN
jgi:hypothetical protein